MITMLKMTNIKKSNDVITFEVYVEDCKSPIAAKYYINEKEFTHESLPKDYKWCEGHFSYAKRAIEEMLVKDKIPKEKNIMWY